MHLVFAVYMFGIRLDKGEGIPCRYPLLLFFFLWYSAATAQQQLPPWEPGMLDIHHISTGRGNAAFLILPDTTTLVIDAGEISDTHPRTRSTRNSALRPDTSLSASGWLCDYIRQFHPDKNGSSLDYAVITHFHDDHFGEWDPGKPLARGGQYALTGIMGLGDQIPIKHMLDRGLHFPVDVLGEAFISQNEKDEYHIVQTLQEYRKFLDWQTQKYQLRHDSVVPGKLGQIALKHPEVCPEFQVQNIAASGKIWTGYKDGDVQELFKAGQYPGENPLSVCLKFTYGPFDYFTGGDISGMDEWGAGNMYSVEAQVAPVVGAVDVATLNHHGNRDSQSPFYVRTLRPRVWVQQCWSSDHPGEEVLRRISSKSLYPGERHIFTTDMLSANIQVIGEKIPHSYANLHGHVVIRVMPGGKEYWVYVLNDFSKSREVLQVFGPFESR